MNHPVVKDNTNWLDISIIIVDETFYDVLKKKPRTRHL